MTSTMSPRDRKIPASPPRPSAPRYPAPISSVRSSPGPRLAAHIIRPPPSSTSPVARPFSSPNGSNVPNAKLTTSQSTPVKAVASNVTPRSTARNSKVGNPISTPNDVESEGLVLRSPVDSKSKAVGYNARFASPRSAISETSASDVNQRNGPTPWINTPPESRVAFVFPHTIKNGTTLPLKSSELGPSFFRAGDGPPMEQQKRPALPYKATSFVYADGRRDSTFTRDQSQLPPTIPIEIERYQDSVPVEISPNDTLVPSDQFDTFDTANATNLASSNFANQPSLAAIAARSTSPPKFDMHLSYRKGASQIIRPQLPSQISASRRLSDELTQSSRRRRHSSLDTVSDSCEDGKRAGHSSTGSVNLPKASHALFSEFTTKNMQQTAAAPPSTSARGQTSYQKGDPTSLVDAPMMSAASIPVTSTGLQLSPQEQESSESLAARARRERKVLDLEISNSSLLAINRSLEKEMRKQKAELRRMRRMTRNTVRRSWLSDGISTLGKRVSDLDEILELEDSLELCNDGEDDDISDEISDIASTAFSDEPMSPGTTSSNDSKQLQEGQKRLQLDLSKHRELLIDSQKMNMSLRRCLGLTEQLIKDGTRALEYRVDTEEILLGGRVLSPEELEGEESNEEDSSYFVEHADAKLYKESPETPLQTTATSDSDDTTMQLRRLSKTCQS